MRLQIMVILLSCFFIIHHNIVIAQVEGGVKTEQHAITSSMQDSLAFELCQMFGSDQGLRDSLLRYDTELDSVNFYKMIRFVKKYGYPNMKLLGDNIKYECVYAAPVVIFLHTPWLIVYNKEYSDLLLEEVKKGNLNQELFNCIIDKYYLAKRGNNFRVYMGSAFGKPCLEDRAKSDSIRAIYGLLPLKEEDFKDCSK